jgi:hypothetical protein
MGSTQTTGSSVLCFDLLRFYEHHLFTFGLQKSKLNSHMSHSTIIHSSMVNPATLNKLEENPNKLTADHVTFDVPLLIRLFELVREDVRTDADLHVIVEKIISLQNKGVLTMDDYQEIAAANGGIDSGQQPKQDSELESIRKLAGIR